MRFDIRALSMEEIDMLLMVRKDIQETVAEDPLAETEEVSSEDFVQDNK